ncbi:TetR/AcrR family transcriptional regulator [Quadrisphaera sp. DSM 44207]|uniref:TetR/AcrR family transcriptional regulator n=1 Tax=Quadrisphaera sp. DSM 44207 TaxID=1881057 RepID=UPI0015A1E90F|nr:TetR/AcrR family transcriptional regulator [Quadrisphaera sp. DSM 44207]
MHDAVRAVIAEHGSAHVTIAEVAARSGVHPATIYRRWGTPAALVLDVAVEHVNAASPLVGTGDLREDLSAYARSAVEGVDRPGGLGFLRAIIAAVEDPGTGRDRALQLIAPRVERIQALLDAAGPAAAGLTPADVVDGLIAPIHYRSLLTGTADLAPADVARLVDNLVLLGRARQPRVRDEPDPLAG